MGSGVGGGIRGYYLALAEDRLLALRALLCLWVLPQMPMTRIALALGLVLVVILKVILERSGSSKRLCRYVAMSENSLWLSKNKQPSTAEHYYCTPPSLPSCSSSSHVLADDSHAQPRRQPPYNNPCRRTAPPDPFPASCLTSKSRAMLDSPLRAGSPLALSENCTSARLAVSPPS